MDYGDEIGLKALSLSLSLFLCAGETCFPQFVDPTSLLEYDRKERA